MLYKTGAYWFWSAVLVGFFSLAPVVAFTADLTPVQAEVVSLYQQALDQVKQGNPAAAIALYEKAVELGEDAFGPWDSNFAALLVNLAQLYRDTGQWDKAETHFKRALTILEKVYGADHSNVADTLNAMGVMYQKQMRLDRAEAVFARALKIRQKVLGPDHPDLAQSINNMAALYYYQGKYSQAEPFFKQAIGIVEKLKGSDHPDLVGELNNLGSLYSAMGRHREALTVFQRALDILEKTGTETSIKPTLLSNLADEYRLIGDPRKGLEIAEKALAIRRKTLGENHPDVAGSLSIMAGMYMDLGRYEETEKLSLQSLAIREKAFGPDHPAVAVSLSALGKHYFETGAMDKAEPCLRRALEIREKAFGPEHPDVAEALANLGEILEGLGQLDEAERLAIRALDIREKALGPEHRLVAESLNNLASQYANRLDYAQALSLYKRALAIDEKVLGPDNPGTAVTLNNIGVFYELMGDFDRSLEFQSRALAIREKAFGPEHPLTAASLNNLASVYQDLGQLEKALAVNGRALEAAGKAYGGSHHNIAKGMSNRAELLNLMGRPEEAKPLYEGALAMARETLGPKHEDTITFINNLAGYYLATGQHEKAARLYSDVLALRKEVLGPRHPSTASVMYNLAATRAAQGRYTDALDLIDSGLEIETEFIARVLGAASEAQKIKFIAGKRWKVHALVGMVLEHIPDDQKAVRIAFEAWLRRKGMVLEAQRSYQEALVHNDNPEALQVFNALSRVRAQLSKLMFAGPGRGDSAVYQRRILELETEKERLEGRLSQLSQSFAINRVMAGADAEKVAAILPPDSALVDFAMIQTLDFQSKDRSKEWRRARFVAFVLHAGASDRIKLIDLADAAEVGRLVIQAKEALTDPSDPSGSGAHQALARLHDLVFAPMKKSLGNTSRLFVSPDGVLNLIPFEVLRDPEHNYLIEDYTFNYLAGGRDLLRFGQLQEKGGKALLIGDPDFDLTPERRQAVVRRLATTEKTESIKTARVSRGMKGLRFSRLVGTRDEVKAIGAILGDNNADMYLGAEAVEEVLQWNVIPAILHLATHGFFLDAEAVPELPGRAFGDGSFEKTPVGRDWVADMFLRSGVALAGANQTLKEGDLARSDGIVTAEKILGLRLRGNDMVVLSACETGLGEATQGEGVFGLRRAFLQAGTRSLVMSMWPVPDRETKELMEHFYRHVTSGSMDRCQALRKAMLMQMKTVQSRYGHSNPLFWGGFVFMGEP